VIEKMNNKKKTARIIMPAAAVAVLLVIGISVASTTTSLATLSHTASAQSFIDSESDLRAEPKAPMAASSDGNNVYIVWWTNKSENWEVMFRASNDGGQTFGDKINLSNSSDAESQTAEILAVGENTVFVSWWETSPETGSSESVLRVSNDAGQTFGPMIMLGTNGTVNTAIGNTPDNTAPTPAVQGEEELLPDEEAVPTEEVT
jgi:hypothetical protein